MNKHKFICEYSQHVLYHYVLIVLWFLLVFGTFVSVAGLVLHLLDITTKWMCHKRKVGSFALQINLHIVYSKLLTYIYEIYHSGNK